MSDNVELIKLEFKESLSLIRCSATCGTRYVVRTTPFAGNSSAAKLRVAEEAVSQLLHLMQSEL